MASVAMRLWTPADPTTDMETGNPYTSVLSYIDCLSDAFNDYRSKVEGADVFNVIRLFTVPHALRRLGQKCTSKNDAH